MAKVRKERHKRPKTVDAPKGGRQGKVVLMKLPDLKLTEVEMLKIKNSNLIMEKLNSDKRALTLQIRETDRAGTEAQVNMTKLVALISKRIGAPLRSFTIEDDGRLIPKNPDNTGSIPSDSGGAGEEKKE